jgi:hypothetical protein
MTKKERVYHCANSQCGAYHSTTLRERAAEQELRAAGWSCHLLRWFCPKCGQVLSKTHNKYNSQKTTADGLEFDSKKEARRYYELRLMLQAGQIRDLKHHTKFTLIESFTAFNGKLERGVTYEADFVYQALVQGQWITVVEDVKSEITRKKPDYVIKRKLLQKLYHDLWFVES